MSQLVESLTKEARVALNRAATSEDLTAFENTYLGRKGKVPSLLRSVAQLPVDERPRVGAEANALRHELETALAVKQSQLATQTVAEDLTVPGLRPDRGHRHPLTVFMDLMADIWRVMGFTFHQGPELDTDWNNFEGLNIPRHHPSRDIQDTFYIKGRPDLVLRTHTSTAQLRATAHAKPPFRIIEMGRVYRNESTDASHESTFFQCDGFAVDRTIRVTDLIGTLESFLQTLYNRKLTIRVRPHFYPFVEPGMDIDMQCILCSGRGCPVCKQSGWLEMLGSGMIHPVVLKNMKLDPKVWKGFAFGMGVDRLAMLYYRYGDVRLAHSGDLRFTQQFS